MSGNELATKAKGKLLMDDPYIWEKVFFFFFCEDVSNLIVFH